ncbi:metal-binding protein [Escherichia coli]|nr:metal-binding protein [Escherichia coli]
MSKISQRIKYTRIDNGYCQICGKYQKLSQDHVPPKCVTLPGAVEQKLITEVMGKKSIKGVKAHHGSVFKTICSVCNNNLSIFDSEIKRVTDKLNFKIECFIRNPFSAYSFISEDIDAKNYLRGIVGHVLAAVPNIACQKDNFEAPFFEPLRRFVIGTNDDIEKTHAFYYWFYPHRMNVAGSSFSIFDVSLPKGKGLSMAACLYFYPVAILIVENGKEFSEVYDIAYKLTVNDKKLYLNLNGGNFGRSIFPFFSIKNTVVALHKAFITVSYSAVNKD